MTRPPPRIVVATHWLSRNAGGLFAAVRRLCQTLHALGHDLRVHGLDDPHFAADAPLWRPIVPTAHRCAGPPGFGFAPSMRGGLCGDLTPPCILHLHGLWKLTSLDCMAAARRGRAPLLISPHGMLDPWALTQAAAKKRLAAALYERRNLRQAACLHAVSAAELRQIRDYGLRNPVAVVPNGTDLPPDSVDAPAPPAVDALPAGCRVLLFVSRIHAKKGLLPLLEAWRDVAPRFAEWILAIVGPDDGGHAAAVKRKVCELGIGSRVLLPGAFYGSERDAWYRRADSFVLPSFSEGFPMAVLEALAHRLPCLITPPCNFPEAARCGAAIEVPPQAPDLAEGLRRMLALNPEERAAMGRRGRQLVEQHYTWPRVAGHMADVYAWLAGERERPNCVAEGSP